MIHRRLNTLTVAALAALNLALSAEAAVTYRKVALTGDVAEASGGTFTGFTTFSMNSSGEVGPSGAATSPTVADITCT